MGGIHKEIAAPATKIDQPLANRSFITQDFNSVEVGVLEGGMVKNNMQGLEHRERKEMGEDGNDVVQNNNCGEG